MASTRAKKPTDVSAASSIRAYLAALQPAERRALTTIRRAIRAAAPEAVEVFGYGIPGFKMHGQPLLYYAAWRAHVSMYPVSAAIRKAFGAQLGEPSKAKGTARFPLTAPPSATLVKRLSRARLAEVAARASRKTTR